MGNQRSRLRRFLAHGDEPAAIELLKNNEDFRKRLDIEFSYEKNDGSNSFHLACLHGMENLIRTFLVEYKVDLMKRNTLQETPIHCLCRLPNSTFLKDLPQYHGDRKHKCLKIIIEQESSLDAGGMAVIEATFTARDFRGDTPLHLAAAHGFFETIEEILSVTKAPLTMKNMNGEMPVDLADQFGQETVAQLLESSIIFEMDFQAMTEIEDQEDWALSHTQCFDGLKTQDLQHKKDQLVVETSDMLHLPLFTAEALLRTFNWSRQSLLDAWFDNPEKCCKNAGVKLPESKNKRRNFAKSGSTDLELSSPKRTLLRKPGATCPICAEDIPNDEDPVDLACEHDFCRRCWREYLTIKIQDGNIYPIICPDSLCSMLVPCDVVESLVSRDIARKYLQFDIEAFVESNPSMKWCPFAGCGRAVCRPELPVPLILDIPHMKPPLETSHAVDCGNGHYFCWECSGEAHEPCSCDKWNEWHQRIIDVRPEEIKGTHEALEEAANNLWLVTNSKPCPNCKSPIQKTDGCNHMKCSKCKHDFCWVCSDSWKKHNTATGGYFRCNRTDAAVKAQDEAGKLITAAEEKSRRMNELNRFVKFYGKYKIQDTALQRATPLLENVDQKISLLSAKLKIPVDQFIFLQQAALELQKARKVLKGSYVYAYYLEDHRMLFEYMQNELEKGTDLLDGLIARRYLRSCKDDITKLTRLVRRRRHEFIVAVNKGLIVPETPPSVRKKGRRGMPGLFGMDFDEMMTQEDIGAAIAASLAEVDPMNPWVKDSRGRHTNLSVLYDWPEFEDTEDLVSMPSTSSMKTIMCARPGCPRVCAKNPRTGILHRHCGISCQRLHEKESTSDNRGSSSSLRVKPPKNLDIMIALELSRLQMRKELENRALSFSSESSAGENWSRINEDFGAEKDEDYDLNLAIELSLHDLRDKRMQKENDSTNLPPEDSPESSVSEAASSLKSSDFTHLDANEILLDHLQKMTDTNTLKNIAPDK